MFEGKKVKSPETPETKPSIAKERKVSRSSLMSRSPKKSVTSPTPTGEQDDDEDVFEGLNASLTVMMHGIESDWIEEEMSDDDDFRWEKTFRQLKSFYFYLKPYQMTTHCMIIFRKDVLEQKVRKTLEDIGLMKKIFYKVFTRLINVLSKLENILRGFYHILFPLLITQLFSMSVQKKGIQFFL